MADPVFDIRLGSSGTDSRVFVNGHDISASIHGVSVELKAGELTKVTLHTLAHGNRVTVAGAIADVKITEDEWADLGRPDDPKGAA